MKVLVTIQCIARYYRICSTQALLPNDMLSYSNTTLNRSPNLKGMILLESVTLVVSVSISVSAARSVPVLAVFVENVA